jgi:hypothetical protein
MLYSLQTYVLPRTVVEAFQDICVDLELQVESDICLVIKPQQHVRNEMHMQIAYFVSCAMVQLLYTSLAFSNAEKRSMRRWCSLADQVSGQVWLHGTQKSHLDGCICLRRRPRYLLLQSIGMGSPSLINDVSALREEEKAMKLHKLRRDSRYMREMLNL